MSAPASSDAGVFRGPLKVEYCSSCGLPPEYCEFGPSWNKCKLLLEKNHPDLLAQALSLMNVAAPPAQPAQPATAAAGGEEEEEAKAAAAPQKKGVRFDDAEEGEAKPKAAKAAPAGDEDEFLAAAAPVKQSAKKLTAGGPGVFISSCNRTKRKFVTTVKGLESVGLTLKDAAKLMSKKFACAASIVKAGDGSSEIQLQGELQQDMAYWIAEEFKQIDKKIIWIEKNGKKVKAF